MSKAAIASGSIWTHLGWITKRQLCMHKALWDVAPCTQRGCSSAKTFFWVCCEKERSSQIFPGSFDFSGPVVWHGQVGIPHLPRPLEVLQAAGGTTELLLDCKKVFRGKIVSSHSHFACDFSYICF